MKFKVTITYEIDVKPEWYDGGESPAVVEQRQISEASGFTDFIPNSAKVTVEEVK